MPLLSGLLGALIGAFLALGFNMWKFHRDERNARCDELCKAIWDLGILASEYWSKPYNPDQIEQVATEAKIQAMQNLVDGLYEDFRQYMPTQSHGELLQQLSDLIDAVTGGEFSVENRKPDRDRLIRAPQTASATIVTIRREYRQSLPMHGLIKAFHDNRHRELDMPVPVYERT